MTIILISLAIAVLTIIVGNVIKTLRIRKERANFRKLWKDELG